MTRQTSSSPAYSAPYPTSSYADHPESTAPYRRVVKLCGRAQSAAELPARIAEAWRVAPGALCVVHGGGDEISALQRRLGGEPTFNGGRRVTTAEDIALIRMVLSGVVNKRLVGSFLAAGTPAVGISGEDASLIA